MSVLPTYLLDILSLFRGVEFLVVHFAAFNTPAVLVIQVITQRTIRVTEHEVPSVWQVDCVDNSPSRLTTGRIGLWSMSSANKYWDNIWVGPNPIAPVINSTPPTTADAGQLYTYDADADGLPEPTYSLIESPAGMTIDANTGLVQ